MKPFLIAFAVLFAATILFCGSVCDDCRVCEVLEDL